MNRRIRCPPIYYRVVSQRDVLSHCTASAVSRVRSPRRDRVGLSLTPPQAATPTEKRVGPSAQESEKTDRPTVEPMHDSRGERRERAHRLVRGSATAVGGRYLWGTRWVLSLTRHRETQVLGGRLEKIIALHPLASGLIVREIAALALWALGPPLSLPCAHVSPTRHEGEGEVTAHSLSGAVSSEGGPTRRVWCPFGR